MSVDANAGSHSTADDNADSNRATDTVQPAHTADTVQSVHSCHGVDVDHVVQLPCVASASHVPSPGQRFDLAEDDVKVITQMIKGIAWPSNAREWLMAVASA